MTRPYEVVYIFDSALEDETITEKINAFHAMIQVPGADAPALDVWGRRTLAYPIKKQQTGYYVVATFETDPVLLPEFERALRLDEAVLRFLVVLNDTPPTPPVDVVARGDDADEEDE
jgi:small subunit ribosomal protein S6